MLWGKCGGLIDGRRNFPSLSAKWKVVTMVDDMELYLRWVMEGLRAAKTRQEVEQWLGVLQEQVNEISKQYRGKVSLG